MIEHLIFDFDGTIADSYPMFVNMWIEVAKGRGVTVPCDEDTLYRALKITGAEAYRVLHCEDIVDYDTFLDDFHALQQKYCYDFSVFPQAVELLRASVKAGKKNYIYTHTGPVVKEMLQNMGILDCFTFILDSSYGFPLKPSPDALQFFLQKFDFDPKTCMMIGDRPIDAHAGMNAGMYGCLWDEEGLFTDAKVDYYIKDLAEVAKIVGI